MKAIKTYYLPATNLRGPRIKATDCDRNSIVLSWAHEFTADENHALAAKALCKKMKWYGEMVMGGFPECNVHVFVDRKFSLRKIA